VKMGIHRRLKGGGRCTESNGGGGGPWFLTSDSQGCSNRGVSSNFSTDKGEQHSETIICRPSRKKIPPEKRTLPIDPTLGVCRTRRRQGEARSLLETHYTKKREKKWNSRKSLIRKAREQPVRSRFLKGPFKKSRKPALKASKRKKSNRRAPLEGKKRTQSMGGATPKNGGKRDNWTQHNRVASRPRAQKGVVKKKIEKNKVCKEIRTKPRPTDANRVKANQPVKRAHGKRTGNQNGSSKNPGGHPGP